MKMFVLIAWQGHSLAVPLVRLAGVGVDEQTREAIDDWRYWVRCGSK